MFCSNCGSKLPEGAKFCPSCGNNCDNDEKEENNKGNWPVAIIKDDEEYYAYDICYEEESETFETKEEALNGIKKIIYKQIEKWNWDGFEEDEIPTKDKINDDKYLNKLKSKGYTVSIEYLNINYKLKDED